MQTISCRLVKVVSEETRTQERRKYNVLQVLVGDNGLKNCLSGEVVSVNIGTMDGKECQAVRMIGNGAKYMRIYKIVDFDLGRKYSIGKNVDVVAVPAVRVKQEKAVIVYVATDDQTSKINDLIGDAFLLPIKDYSLKTHYQLGDVKIPVFCSAWGPTDTGRVGFNYRVIEE